MSERFAISVRDFKRRLLEETLRDTAGNSTHAARVLGLERSYLVRLIRELAVDAVAPVRGRPPSGVS